MPTDPAQNQLQPPRNLDWSSLAGTMLPWAIQSLSQATSQEDLDAVHQQVQQAQQAAAQAGQQYQQAAQQPAPPPPPNFYDQLLSNTASVLGHTPEYRQQAFQRQQDAQQALSQQRLQNLQSLKDQYDNQAANAERLGNTQMSMQARLKSEQLAKSMSLLMKGMGEASQQQIATIKDTGATTRTGMQQAGAKERNVRTTGVTRQNAIDTNATRLATAGLTSTTTGAGGGTPQATFESAFGPATQTDFGPIYNMGKVKGVADQRRLRQLGAQAGVALLSEREYGAAQDMESSWRTLENQAEQLKPYLYNGTDPTERMKQAAKNEFGMVSGQNTTLAAFNSMWANTVRTMRAQAGSGGLRINKSEIDRAIKWDRPDPIWDTQPILEQKMKNWAIIRQNAMNPLVSNDWRSIPKSGKVTVMDRQGTTSVVPQAQADQLIANKGYARVLTEADVDPRLKAAANARLLNSMGSEGTAPSPASAAPPGTTPEPQPAPAQAPAGETWERGPDGKPRLVRR